MTPFYFLYSQGDLSNPLGFGFDNIQSNNPTGTIYAEKNQNTATWSLSLVSEVPRPVAGCRTPRPDLGERWPSRLVATAAENRLNIPAQPHTRRCGPEQVPNNSLLTGGS